MEEMREEVIYKFGGEESLKDFIEYLLIDITEREIGDKLKNLFLIKYEVGFRFGTKMPYIRIYWSGDNFPECQKIYANNFSLNIEYLFPMYRDYKIDKILS